MLDIVFTSLENSWLAVLLTAVTAYLLGSINSAVIVSRALFKEDVREKGSGNAGATN
ncbi:MAG: glycerol-3-phosphate acyltransferase, partial [Clostridia bacterium]|nr:glycerol-3-phosphate acyltransferase [Clostridia bacterium]